MGFKITKYWTQGLYPKEKVVILGGAGLVNTNINTLLIMVYLARQGKPPVKGMQSWRVLRGDAFSGPMFP